MEKTEKRKKWWIIPVVVAVLGIAAALYFFLGKEKVNGTAYVQKVSEIIRQGGTNILSDRYIGVVEAKNMLKIKLDEEKKVAECFVSVGDSVEPGDPLFSYDVDSLSMTYDQLRIDYETKLNSITNYENEIAKVKKQIKKAKARELSELNIQLQTAELNVKKEQYESEQKKKQIDDMEKIIADNVVKSTISGRIKSINPPTEDDSGSSDGVYMTIVADNDYWVKGTISEQGAYQLIPGMNVTVRSRLDKNVIWKGTITNVNLDAPVSSTNNYYSGDSSDTASKYNFFITLENTDGLMMGQHLYIELGNESGKEGLYLPAFYVMEEDGNTFVFAEDTHGRIEKRRVETEEYDEEMGAYKITAGLSLLDCLAFPDETVQVGMKAQKTNYAEEDSSENLEETFGEEEYAEYEEEVY